MIGGGNGRSAGAATGACATAGAFATLGALLGQRFFGLLMDAGRFGGARRSIAVGTQAFDRGAGQIVGIATFLRRSRCRCNRRGFDRSDRGGHRDRSGWRRRCGRGSRRLHGLDRRRQYHPDLFSLGFSCGSAVRIGRLGIGGLGIGGLGIGGFGVSGLAVGFLVRFCFGLPLGLFDRRRPFGGGLLHDGLLGDTLGLDAGGRKIADAGRGVGRLRFGFGFRRAIPLGIGGRCRRGRRRIGVGLGSRCSG